MHDFPHRAFDRRNLQGCYATIGIVKVWLTASLRRLGKTKILNAYGVDVDQTTLICIPLTFEIGSALL
jgi:hypothetical protein